MKRAYRLRKPQQFQRARREGRSWSSALVALNAVGNKRHGTRCGFVVGKRIGKAVERNRARRRLREAVRLALAQIAPGWDLVFVVRSPAVATVPFAELQTLVEQLLRRAGLWREPRETTG
ncbi:MAG TPA: ribonuclease P protein component [Kouleothrix sp.]|nr:ribonuclease P protein component [Kouleothrix sp.]